MIVDLRGYEKLTRQAVAHYWQTLLAQGSRQREGDADRGGRAAVTGGKQMDGFCHVISTFLLRAGLSEENIHIRRRLELPGYFRPTKNWDMLVVHEGNLLAAIEFKSQRGPSFGNNFNNRTEEAIGTAQDLWVAYREGAFGMGADAPWLGWLMLLEDCEASSRPVGVSEPHFPVFSEFREASYTKRYELLLRKLILEKLYTSAAFLLATESGGPHGEYHEPNTDLTMKRMLASLLGHISAYLAAR